jgi:hypothetical protein
MASALIVIEKRSRNRAGDAQVLILLGLACLFAQGASVTRAADAAVEVAEPTRQQWAERRAQQAAAVALSPLDRTGKIDPPDPALALPAVPHVPGARPEDVDRRWFDVIIYGGTPCGVASAVRAARTGCRVLLVQHDSHLGGMMTNGLMQWDALYGGPRAAIFTELLRNIEQHYIATYGRNSPDHQRMRYTHEHYPIGWCEPHVAEREFHRLVAKEPGITLLFDRIPANVDRQGAIIRSVTFRRKDASGPIHVRGQTFIDASYEGDLVALAGVPYRVGREGRDEYHEPHAGKLFVNIDHGPAPQAALEGLLNIFPYQSRQGSIDPDGPGSADGAVQAYNFRFCVSRDPKNRLLPGAPPPGYNRDDYLRYDRKSIATNPGPNFKSHMNSPILPGENHAYPEADWETRNRISRRHLDFALGLMYFLQNDESIPARKREEFRQWGLAKDEFADNGNVPYEMYVREARRIVGREIFTEQQASLAEGLHRTPIQGESIAITDWYMDSHACTAESRPGFRYDGKLILTQQSRPAQISYRTLLPRGTDNLLVPLCLSASHVAWGAVRLEPVWMQTGEAAGWAAGLAKRKQKPVSQIDVSALQRVLIEQGQMVTFFNDLPAAPRDAVKNAAQFFGTKGFFASYDADLSAPLTEPIAQLWAQGFGNWQQQELDAASLARAIAKAEDEPGTGIRADQFLAMLPSSEQLEPADAQTILTRGEALAILWKLLPH